MEDSNRGGIDAFKRLWQLVASPTHKRTLTLLVLLVIIAAVPLTVFVAQKQQEIRQRAATTSGIGTCRDLWPSETIPPSGSGQNYYWKADCSKGCSSNADCPQNASDQCNVTPGDSNWCYGFEGGWKCLQQRHLSVAGDKGSDTYGNCTVSCPGGVCGGEQAPDCDVTKVNMSASPASVAVGQNITFSLSGAQGSTWVRDTFSGGVGNCTFPVDWPTSTSCKTTAAGTFTWTHYWQNCAPNNCEIKSAQCKKPLKYTIGGGVTPTPTTPPSGNSNLYINPITSSPGQTLTVVATSTVSCSTYISSPPNSGGGYRNCTESGGFVCNDPAKPNPIKDGKPCWWRWSCTAGSAGKYTAKFDAGSPVNPACHAEKAYTVGSVTPTPTKRPTPTPTRVVTPTPTGQAGSAKLLFDLALTGVGLGLGDNRTPQKPQRDLTVCLYALTTNTANDSACSRGTKKTGTITYNTATGHFINSGFDLGTIGNGRYQVFVKTNRYLRRRIPQVINVTAGQTTQVPQVTLIVGDSI